MDRDRRPELDGLRGVAIALVLAAHATTTVASYWLGVAAVSLFCLLSGWLITGRLQSGQRLRQFFARRAARLLPALLLMVAVTAPLFAALGEPLRPGLMLGLTYTTDLAPLVGINPLGPYLHLWTLSLEEQFYLLWPVVFIVAGRRAVPWLAAAGCASLALKGGIELRHQGTLEGMIGPGANLWPLAFGAMWAMTGRPVRVHSWLAWRPLVWLGRRSYGIYLWNFPLIWLAFLVTGTIGWQLSLVADVITLVVAALSWRLVEQPILGMTRSSSRSPGAVRRHQRAEDVAVDAAS